MLPIKEKSWSERVLFNNPLLKFAFFILVYVILDFILEDFAETTSVRVPLTIVHGLLAIYFISVMVYVVRHSMRRMVSSRRSSELIGYYLLFLIGIILMLSTVLNIIELSRTGYITYGKCSDTFTSSMVKTDPQRSHNFFYYTAMLFTVGYGDICPMGLAKLFSIITAILGHVLSVILVALIVNNHFKLREKEK